MYGVCVEMETEMLSDDPPKAFDAWAGEWRIISPELLVPRWLVWEDDEIVAVAVGVANLTQNLDNGFARIHVRLQHRGRRLARQLATPVLDWLESQKQRRVATFIAKDAPWEALAERATDYELFYWEAPIAE